MSDLEQRLSDALVRGAGDAPAAQGLAAAARSRARRRRRNRLAGAAAAVVLAVGVPTAVVATRGPGEEPAPRPSDQVVARDPEGGGPLPGLPDGYRYESWRDVTVEVPDSWGYGSSSDWCADQGTPDTPRIERPGTVHLDILCTPSSSYGLSFAPAQQDGTIDWPVAEQHSDAWPDGAFVGATTVGDVVVTVVAPDLIVAQGVISSAQRNESLDPDGCPVTTGSDPVVPADTMTVCRYDQDGQLEQSELLAGADVASAEHALRDAPLDTRRGPYCATRTPPTTLVRMASLSLDATVSFGGSCWSDDRVLVDGQPRMLGRAVLYWALSPGWSGSVPGGVSLPSELRSP